MFEDSYESVQVIFEVINFEFRLLAIVLENQF